MIIGYYARNEDNVSGWLSRMSKIENIPLIEINADSETKQHLDYLIVGGAPINTAYSNDSYWEGLSRLAEKFPKTTILIQELPYCTEEGIKERMGKKSNLKILETDIFVDKVNELINKAK